MSESRSLYKYCQIQDNLGHGRTPVPHDNSVGVSLAQQIIARRADPSQINPMAKPVETPKSDPQVNQILGTLR